MRTPEIVLIIPAAGTGTRLQSTTPKVLSPVNGRAMIDHLLDRYRQVVQRFVLVVHPSFEADVKRHVERWAPSLDVQYATQPEPTGMLDAIMLASDAAQANSAARVWITWCDQIGVHPRTITTLHRMSVEHSGAAAILPTSRQASPYIHLDRDARGRITAIRQRREKDEMPPVGESDMGCSLSRRLGNLLPQFSREATQAVSTRERTSCRSCHGSFSAATLSHFSSTKSWKPSASTRRTIAGGSSGSARFGAAVNALDRDSGLQRRAVHRSRCSKHTRCRSHTHGPKRKSSSSTTARKRHSEVSALSRRRLCRHERNGGKAGGATGIERATGDYVMIQDPISTTSHRITYRWERRSCRSRRCRVPKPYTSGLIGSKHPQQSWPPTSWKSLSVAALLTTGRYVTDTVTALKLFPRPLLNELGLETAGFELDHEITSKVLARGCRIVEVPIHYFPRSRDEGKKIGAKDWIRGLQTFWRYRRG